MVSILTLQLLIISLSKISSIANIDSLPFLISVIRFMITPPIFVYKICNSERDEQNLIFLNRINYYICIYFYLVKIVFYIG